MKKEKIVDKFFLGLIISLVIFGIFIFVSASLGVLAKSEKKFYSILFNQLFFGLGGGLLFGYIFYRINYQFWKKYAFYIFIFCLALSALVFVPGLGFEHGGARRWVSISSFSFQPVEFLKFGFVLYFAAWMSWMKNKATDFKFAILPLFFFLAAISFILFKQPDTKSFIIILAASLVIAFIAGIPWKYIGGLILVAIIALVCLVYFKPYIFDRVQTFINPDRDPTGSSFQLQQSLIAIGSGGLMGRGLGQSVQKFSYLPEPQGDSVFAVVGEEFGFIGSVILILLFVFLALRGYKIANHSPDHFSKFLVAGLITMIITQAFLNIASIIGVIPLTGVPLPFVGHGGTSLLVSLAEIGIILNISKYQKLT